MDCGVNEQFFNEDKNFYSSATEITAVKFKMLTHIRVVRGPDDLQFALGIVCFVRL